MTLKIKILKYHRILKSDNSLDSKTSEGHTKEKNIKIFLKIINLFVKILKVYEINISNNIFDKEIVFTWYVLIIDKSNVFNLFLYFYIENLTVFMQMFYRNLF